MLGSAAISDDLLDRFWKAVAAMPATHTSQREDVQHLDESLLRI